jgi:hypothetical protein
MDLSIKFGIARVARSLDRVNHPADKFDASVVTGDTGREHVLFEKSMRRKTLRLEITNGLFEVTKVRFAVAGFAWGIESGA